MDFLMSVLESTIRFAAPIILCTLGGIFTYKANIINIGLEGIMLFGGFATALILYFLGFYWLSVLGAVMAGVLVGLLFCYFGITRKGNFIITGFAINLLAMSFGFYTLALLGRTDIPVVRHRATMIRLDFPLIRDIPYLGRLLNNHPLFTYVAYFSIFIVFVILYRTRFGVHLRVTGESPEAAKAVGLKVDRIKYIGVVIGSIFVALAGFNVTLEHLGTYTPVITAGIGFIAIAAIYCGRGSPGASSLYAILFGLMRALSVRLSLMIGAVAGLFQALPYLTVIIILAVVAIIRNQRTNVRSYTHE